MLIVPKFHPGNVVRVKGQYVRMTVTVAHDGDRITVAWFDCQHHLHQQDLPADILESAE